MNLLAIIFNVSWRLRLWPGKVRNRSEWKWIKFVNFDPLQKLTSVCGFWDQDSEQHNSDFCRKQIFYTIRACIHLFCCLKTK